jgi:hypothetical protein
MIGHMTKPTSALLTLLAVAAFPAAVQAQTQGVPTPTRVAGPAGTHVLRPPAAALPCNAPVRADVRFTRRSAAAGVRAVTVRLGARSVTVRPGKRPGWRRVAFAPACGVTTKLSYKALRTKGRRAVTKRFGVVVAPKPVQAPVTEPGTTIGGSNQSEPGGAPKLNSAASPDPAGNPTTWQTFASLRTGGPRQGQTCAQTLADNDGARRVVYQAFCGRPEQDAVFARSGTVADPHTGAQRTVVSGVASPDLVSAVAVEGPAGRIAAALSGAEAPPGVGGEFIAVFDGSITVSALTLVVTRSTGEELRFANPTAVNLRSAGQ